MWVGVGTGNAMSGTRTPTSSMGSSNSTLELTSLYVNSCLYCYTNRQLFSLNRVLNVMIGPRALMRDEGRGAFHK